MSKGKTNFSGHRIEVPVDGYYLRGFMPGRIFSVDKTAEIQDRYCVRKDSLIR